jgi:hypothetical protein
MAACVFFAVAGWPTAANGLGTTRTRGIVYGDSLVVQSLTELRVWQLTKADVRYQAHGGAALCDYAPQMPADNVAFHPDWVVLAFTGNTASGTCAGNAWQAGGDAGAVENYRNALRQARAAFPTTTRIYVVGAIAMLAKWQCAAGITFSCWFPFNGYWGLNVMYMQEAASLPNTVYDPTADEWLTATHRFWWTSPCLPGECIGTIRIRSVDGVHLWDGNHAGQFRYAAAITTRLRADYPVS